MIQLNKIKDSCHELVLGDFHILFSYSVPVVFSQNNASTKTFWVTNKRFSKTTTRHINDYVYTENVKIIYVSQNELEDIIAFAWGE